MKRKLTRAELEEKLARLERKIKQVERIAKTPTYEEAVKQHTIATYLSHQKWKEEQEQKRRIERKRREQLKSTWYFEWKEGGYNTVRAFSREEALRLAIEFGLSVHGKKLHPKVETLRTVTYNELRELERKWSAMFD